jgi:hypothetical protein
LYCAGQGEEEKGKEEKAIDDDGEFSGTKFS